MLSIVRSTQGSATAVTDDEIREGVDGRMRFRVAPASLVFHDVSDLRIWISAAVPAGGAPILLDEQRLPVAGRPHLMREDNGMTQGDRNDR